MIRTTITITTANCNHTELLEVIKQFAKSKNLVGFAVESEEVPDIELIKTMDENKIHF